MMETTTLCSPANTITQTARLAAGRYLALADWSLPLSQARAWQRHIVCKMAMGYELTGPELVQLPAELKAAALGGVTR